MRARWGVGLTQHKRYNRGRAWGTAQGQDGKAMTSHTHLTTGRIDRTGHGGRHTATHKQDIVDMKRTKQQAHELVDKSSHE